MSAAERIGASRDFGAQLGARDDERAKLSEVPGDVGASCAGKACPVSATGLKGTKNQRWVGLFLASNAFATLSLPVRRHSKGTIALALAIGERWA